MISDKNRLDGSIDGGGKPGIDHPYVIDGSETFSLELRDVAELQSETRKMTVKSTQPVVVVYTTNWLPIPDSFSPNDEGGIHR